MPEIHIKINIVYLILTGDTGDENLRVEGWASTLPMMIKQYEEDSKCGSDGKTQFERRDEVINFVNAFKIVGSVIIGLGTLAGAMFLILEKLGVV